MSLCIGSNQRKTGWCIHLFRFFFTKNTHTVITGCCRYQTGQWTPKFNKLIIRKMSKKMNIPFYIVNRLCMITTNCTHTFPYGINSIIRTNAYVILSETEWFFRDHFTFLIIFFISLPNFYCSIIATCNKPFSSSIKITCPNCWRMGFLLYRIKQEYIRNVMIIKFIYT